MRPSERIVFLILLERSDNADCSVPTFLTPSLRQLADAAGYSVSTTTEALTHLEKHRWIARTRSKGGQGRKRPTS
jgi:DNA-binding MarR family transcriptional regulator